MASIDSNVIIENLTQLLTNSVNMTSVFYDIFLNPEPMDVQLQQYDANGDMITIEIPNRAKDREIALVGEGSPEGVVTANIGACYVDELNEAVYFKATGTGNTGWVIVLTEEGVNNYLRAYLSDNDFMTEDDTNRYLINNNYATTTTVSNMLAQYQPVVRVTTLATSGTVALADNTTYAITATGNITFALPSVTDLTYFHKILVQLYMSTARTITLGTINYFNKTAPDLSTAGSYNITYEYDNTKGVWVVGAVSKGTVS